MSTLVDFVTNQGNFRVELADEAAPKTVANFLAYVRSGHYAGTIFHRVISNFMIQGGGFNAQMQQQATQAPIENEADVALAAGWKNTIGTLAMARTNDPHSASTQFFINVANNDFLNHSGKNAAGWGYAVFGKVVSGMDTIEKIKAVKTGKNGFHSDVPLTAVVIESAAIVA